MSIKVCIFTLSMMAMIFFGFPRTATCAPDQCYHCSGAKQEPYQDPGCSKTHNCTGAKNMCTILLFRNDISGTDSYLLECIAEVDCKRGGVGCKKQNEETTMCRYCCTSDLCNVPTYFKVTEPPTTPATSSSGHVQVLPFTIFLATIVFWFGYYSSP